VAAYADFMQFLGDIPTGDWCLQTGFCMFMEKTTVTDCFFLQRTGFFKYRHGGSPFVNRM